MLVDGLEDWQRYIGSSSDDPLLQIAVAHAQFEVLHPFKDGNGRIGRMLVPLMLYQRKALSRPMFYMSEYFEAHRQTYYDRLLGVTADRDWHGWLEFFLTGIEHQATMNLSRVRAIRELYEQTRKQIVDITRSQYAMAVADALFRRPVISATTFMRDGGFQNRNTANNMLRQLESDRLIKRIREGGGRTPAIYAFPRLIEIAEGRPVFEEAEPRLI